MMGNNRQLIRALVFRRQISVSSSSCLYQTLTSTPIKTSSPLPSKSPSTNDGFITKLHFPTSALQLFQRTLCSSSSANIFLVKSDEGLNSGLKNAQDNSSPAVFYFTATWCGPCRFISPVIEELSRKYPHVTIYKVDIDTEGLQNALAKLQVSAVPTFHLFKNGKKATTIVGADVTQLKDIMKDLYRKD